MKEKTAWAVFFIDKLFMKIYAIIVPSINVKEVKRSSYYEKEKRS